MSVVNRLIQRLLPRSLHPIGAGVRWFGFAHQCPVCRWYTRTFRPIDANPKVAERCSRCGSLARHRLLWLFFQRHTNLFSARLRVLHISPEACFIERLRQRPNLEYITADLAGGYASWMETMDITAIAKPDDSYDAILCIHVLQAVEDDAKAMRELYRVLRPGGWAILNSRIDSNAPGTQPCAGLPSAEERAKATHQDFTYRIYGQDFPEHLRRAGFEVEVFDFGRSFSEAEIHRLGLRTPPEIFLCRKPLSGETAAAS